MLSYVLLDILIVSLLLFVIGLLGIFVVRKNLIVILMALEIILFAININFIFFSVYLDDMTGQLMALLVLTIAASESAIGLAILVIYYRLRGVINLDEMKYLKG